MKIKNKINNDDTIGSRVLIVEDEMIAALDMKQILINRGYEVDMAINGKKALDMAKKMRPDIVLMDIILKGKIDGIETAKRLKKSFKIPIIFVSAFTSEKMLQRAKLVEPYAYIVKPFEESELYTNVEMALYTHQMKKVLEESEARLKILFEYAPDAYYLNDLKGTLLDGNKASEELTGYKREELIGKNFFELNILMKKQLPKVAALLAKNALGKATGPDEFILVRKDGTQRNVEVRTYPVKIDGKIRILGLARDISAREEMYRTRELLLHDMGQRIKELTCMYGTIKSIRERNTLEDIFKDLVVIMPSGWQYPEIARAKICYRHRIFRALPFRETRWLQTSPIIINGEKQGSVEMYYTKSRPKSDEGPFTREERQLLDNITKTLSEAIERKQMEERIIQLASFPEQNPNPVMETDITGKISFLNPAAKKRFPNITSEGLKNPLLHDIDSIIKTIKRKGNDSLTREVKENNSIYEEKICYLPKNDLIRIYAVEITKRKKTEQTLRKLTLIDPLTGLYNRRGFLTLVEQQQGRADRIHKGFIILYADLDRMKWINDSFGHHVGDIALKTVGEILHQSFRKSDIIARIGGDEFAVCAVEAKADSENLLRARIQEQLANYNDHAELDFALSLSIGCVYYDAEQHHTLEELLTTADENMYIQKTKKHKDSIVIKK